MTGTASRKDRRAQGSAGLVVRPIVPSEELFARRFLSSTHPRHAPVEGAVTRMQLRWMSASLLLLLLLMLLLQVAGVEQGHTSSSTSLQRWERSPAHGHGFHAPSRHSAKTRRYSRRDRQRRPGGSIISQI